MLPKPTLEKCSPLPFQKSADKIFLPIVKREEKISGYARLSGFYHLAGLVESVPWFLLGIKMNGK